AANYEAQLTALPKMEGDGDETAGAVVATSGGAETEVARLKSTIEDLESSRKTTARRLRDIMKKCSQNEERFLAAVETEKARADRFEEMLEDSRRERDAECERLQHNIDSQKEQLDVKVATVKHLWEKVAAIRRVKAVGSEDLKAHLDEAVSARDSLSRLAEDQQEQIDRLRRRAKRKEEEITKTVLARLQAQEASGSSVIDDDEMSLGGAARGDDGGGGGGGGGRESLDSAAGTTRGASAALRSQLADIKAERMDLMCKCQRQEQQVADLRRLVDEITKLESGAPDAAASGGGGGGGDTWETQSGCSDLSGMSLDSSLMPRGVEDIPEKDLRELAKWFKSRSSERRRLLKRYKTGRQKTEALAARKQAGGDVFASVRGKKPTKGGLARTPTSDTESVKSARSGQSVRSARSAKSASTTASNISARLARASAIPSSSSGPGGGGTFSSPKSERVGGRSRGTSPRSATGAPSRPAATAARSARGKSGGGGAGGSGGHGRGRTGRDVELRSGRSPRAGTRAMGGRTGWL
ncbi:unnamed protein product, partial [Ectocarpus sp. 12 AP-2014]